MPGRPTRFCGRLKPRVHQPGATGNVHFSMKALMRNYDGIADKLKAGPYAEPALVPESRWLGDETPPAPEVVARRCK